MPSDTYDLVAIGNAIVDIVRRTDDAFVAELGWPKGRMTMVESPSDIALARSKLKGGIEVAGGSAANTAVGVASFGGRAAFIGKVAEDEFGRMFRHDIRGTGVAFPTPAVAIAGKVTSHSLVLVTPDGRRTMGTYLGCSTEFDGGMVDEATIRNAKIVHLEGYLFDRPRAQAAFHDAIAYAKAAGCLVSMALADPLCVDRHRAAFLGLVRSGLGLVIANEAEIMSLYETDDFDEAVRRVGQDTALAVLTRSAKGSVVVHKGEALAIAPEPISRVVDATGAGDIYASGFLFGLARGLGHKAAGRLASFAATEILGQLGARPEVRLANRARMRGLLP